MSSPPEPEHSEPIFIILSGFKGRYHSIQRAYNYGHPALEWSRKEVKQTIKGGGDPNTDFPDNNTREMSTWADDENGIYARFGFTVVEKTLTLPGPEELPYGTSQVHMVCDEQNLEISYVSTDHSDAEKVCEKQAGSVVKSVEYVRQQDFDRVCFLLAMLTMDWPSVLIG
ncbi:hypothetical protein XPA_005029 [Xanthoria parietina]